LPFPYTHKVKNTSVYIGLNLLLLHFGGKCFLLALQLIHLLCVLYVDSISALSICDCPSVFSNVYLLCLVCALSSSMSTLSYIFHYLRSLLLVANIHIQPVQTARYMIYLLTWSCSECNLYTYIYPSKHVGLVQSGPYNHLIEN
jgi:hypothetical protein